MKIPLLVIAVFSFCLAKAQKEEWKKTGDGDMRIVYHSNGKVSTEILISNKVAYLEQGYAKAWDRKGNLIYEKPVSRTAMISSVFFKYYDNGAVKSAEFSSHPDAGIQWYREWTTFSEDGTITDVQKQSHDDTVTLRIPETYKEEFLQQQQKKEEKKVNKDSLDFYNEYKKVTNTVKTEEICKVFPDKGYRETTWYENGKKIRSKTEFFKPSAVLFIEREYHRNGKVKSEKMVEKNVYHVTTYGKNGKVISKDYNIPVGK